MKTKMFVRLSIFILLISMCDRSFSQIIEVGGGIGYAAVDMNAWSGIEPEDWGNFSSYYGAQILFPIGDKVAVGAGVAYQYLFWYYFRYPYGSQTLDITRDVDATHVQGIVRFNLKQNFIELTVGPYFFEDFIDLSLGVQFGHEFRLSEKFGVPIRVGTTIIADSDAVIIPITAGAGLSYRFK